MTWHNRKRITTRNAYEIVSSIGIARQVVSASGYRRIARCKGWIMAETREVMGIREASDYLGISRETLYKYVVGERIPAFKLGNRWKFKKTILDRWMERQSAQREERGGAKSRASAR